MTALDLGTATRSLVIPDAASATAFPFGDVDLVSPGGPQPITTYGGVRAISRDYSGGAVSLTSESAIAVADNWAVFIVLAQGDLLTGGQTLFFHDTFGAISSSTTQLQYANGTEGEFASWVNLVTELTASPVVFALIGNATETVAMNSLDGLIASGAPAVSVAPGDFTIPPSGSDALVMGAWMFESVTVSQSDAIDTMSAIIALAPVVENFTATGSYDVTGTATITEGVNPFLPIAPPIVTAGGSATPPAPPVFAPAIDIPDAVIRHVHETMPIPTLDANGWPVDWTPTSKIDAEYGRLQIIVEGVDITVINGIRTPFPTWSDVEPGGYQAAAIELPQFTVFHAPPAWAVQNATVEIRIERADLSGSDIMFVGLLFDPAINPENGKYTLNCIGLLFGSDYQLRLPSFTTSPQDIGTMIPSVLNGAVSRRYLDMAKVSTGIQSSVAGGWEPMLTGFIQQILATALKNSRQWTIHCNYLTPVLEKKDTTTIAWTVRAGQRGIDVDLHQDSTDQVSAIYGEGTDSAGGHWRNAQYPNWKPDDTPAYPFTNPATTIRIGTTDAATDTGNGVSTWQTHMRRNVTGVFSAEDSSALWRLQAASGITKDGILGPQSWATTFDTGANTGTLDGAFIAPLASATEVEPRLIGPQGDDLGANPAYDPDVVRIERKLDYGQGVPIATARTNAEELLARDGVDGWYGSVRFDSDPDTKPRFALRAGENGRILGWRGEDITVHTASVDVDVDGATLAVDTKARDYPTLSSVMESDRNATDPAKAAVKRLLTGNIGTDRPVFDAESPAGRMPRHAIFGGLWDVRRMPMNSFGTVSRTEFTTSSSAQIFSLAVFGKAVTAATLVATLGNPLTAVDNPWENDALDDLGLLMSWGWTNQPAGYYPKMFSNPSGETAAPVTGRLVDDASWEYASSQSPWLWVATFSPASCYVEGRFFGGAR